MRSPALARFWQQWLVRISLTQVLAAAALLFASDYAYYHVISGNTSAWPVALDWVAHITTALLILNLAPLTWRRAILLPALIGSFAIDVDHVPQYFFDTRFLTEGTARPYTHSWVTPAALLLLALVIPRWRVFCFGLAVGVMLHFLRDLAEFPGSGIAAFWPFTDHTFGYSHVLYQVIMAAVVLANLLRLELSRLNRWAGFRDWAVR